ncbi:MAG: GNAT family N-acetyltransferase [Spirochaetaceae bacterium]
MKEELSDEVVDQIVFGMEDQEHTYYFDRERHVVIKTIVLPEEKKQEASRRYVALPDWRPVDGFYMMEQFIGSLKNPIYREELRDALKGGRGVFRRFKDFLKRHEPLERLWFNFKEGEMRRIVRRWYGKITDAEELEKLGEEPEETEQLLLSDLAIEERGESPERRDEKIEKAMGESLYDVSAELRELIIEERLAVCGEEESTTVEAMDDTGEVVGTAGGELFSLGGGDVFKLLYLYVEPLYRGMGLSRLLLDRMTESAKRVGAKELVVDIPSGSSFLERELFERGFNEYLRSFSLGWSRFE